MKYLKYIRNCQFYHFLNKGNITYFSKMRSLSIGLVNVFNKARNKTCFFLSVYRPGTLVSVRYPMQIRPLPVKVSSVSWVSQSLVVLRPHRGRISAVTHPKNPHSRTAGALPATSWGADNGKSMPRVSVKYFVPATVLLAITGKYQLK